MPLVYKDKIKPHTHLMVELPIAEKGLKKVLYVGKGAPMSVVKLPVEEFHRVYEQQNANQSPMKHQ